MILKTTNGGDDWITQAGGTNEHLYSIQFKTSNIGFIVGANGVILKTTNGGNTWITQTSGTAITLKKVFFTTTSIGYVVGNVDYSNTAMFKTTNGGSTWSSYTTGATEEYVNDIFFLNQNTGWLAGNFEGGVYTLYGGKILKTTDGGSTWVQQKTSIFENEFVYFADENNGWTADCFSLYRTKDGGENWYEEYTGYPWQFRNLFFEGNNNFWVYGVYGIKHSVTGGNLPLQATNLVSPLNSSTNISIPNEFVCEPVPNATEYYFQFSENSEFPQNATKSRNSETNTLEIELEPNTTYYWRVQVNGFDYSISPWSETWNFTTRDRLATPQLISPENNATDISIIPTFHWEEVANATGYKIQVSWSIYFSSWDLLVNEEVNSNLYSATNLLQNRTYFWRVIAVAEGYTNSLSSEIRTFTTGAGGVISEGTVYNQPGAYPAPYGNWYKSARHQILYKVEELTEAGVCPGDLTSIGFHIWYQNNCGPLIDFTVRIKETSSNEVTFWDYNGWTTVFYASSYQPTSKWNFHQFSNSFAWNGISNILIETCFNNYPNDETQNASHYYTTTNNYSVIAFRSNDASNICSSTNLPVENSIVSNNRPNIFFNSVPNSTLVATTLSEPQNNETNVTINTTFEWSAVPGATSYSIQISTDSEFETYQIYENGIEGTSFFASELSYNTLYYWRVSGSGNCYQSSIWSDIWSFTTEFEILSTPVLISPGFYSYNVMLTPSFHWYAVENATSYTIQISTESDFSDFVVNQSGLGNPTYTVATALENNTTYYWRVNASADEFATSEWSYTNNFSTLLQQLAPPSLTTPENWSASISTTPEFVWQTVENAESYNLQLSNTSNFSNLILNVYGITETNYICTVQLESGTLYYWRISATGENFNTSNWSVPWRFWTLYNQLEAPVLTYPDNYSTGISVTPGFFWWNVPNATLYNLQISRNSAFSDLVIDNSSLTSPWFYLNTQLESNRTYYWRVRAWAPGWFTSPWSEIWYFSTVAEIQIGDGTEYNTTVSYPAPYGQYYNGARHQLLITADEIFAGGGLQGQINMLGFNVFSAEGVNPLIALQINMKHTSATEITDWDNSNWTTVYTTPDTYNPVSGWNYHYFDNPFDWNGTSNILIEICFNNYPSGFSLNARHYYTTTSFNSVVYFRSDIMSDLCTSASLTANLSSNRPNMLLNFENTEAPLSPPGLIYPDFGSIQIPVNPTYSWSWVANADEYQIQVATDEEFNEILINADTDEIIYNFNENLLYETIYYWRVRALDSEQTSNWSDIWSFQTESYFATNIIELNTGWNLISSNVIPEFPLIDELFSTVFNLNIVKNGEGQIYDPALGIDQIGDWNIAHGYMVYVTAPATLQITGTEVNPTETEINLVSGWNLVAYFRNSPLAISTALEGISNSIILLKNNLGQLYYPAYGLNTIGNMQPGQGYWIYMNAPAVLTYPGN